MYLRLAGLDLDRLSCAVGLSLHGLSPFLVRVVPLLAASVRLLTSHISKGCAILRAPRERRRSVPAKALEGIDDIGLASFHPHASEARRNSLYPPARVGGASGTLRVITARIPLIRGMDE